MSDDHHDRKPLMEKLEPMRTHTPRSGFHSERNAWSKTGRDFFQMLMDFVRAFFEF